MNDEVLTESDQKEGLSLVHVKALAIQAGYSYSIPEPDRDSIDLCVHAGGKYRPALHLQLKATVNLQLSQEDDFPFRLKMKNYRDLCMRTQAPRLLVVLDLPEDKDSWLTEKKRKTNFKKTNLLAKSSATK